MRQIYADTSGQAQTSLQEVARRARSPGTIRDPRKHSGGLPSDSKAGSGTSSPSSLSSLPASAPTSLEAGDVARSKDRRRSKVFRHHLRLEGDRRGLYCHSSPPVLPPDYKETLPTLPDIARYCQQVQREYDHVVDCTCPGLHRQRAAWRCLPPSLHRHGASGRVLLSDISPQ